MTSEEKYNICEQPDPTCNTVDEVKKTLQRAIGYAQDGRHLEDTAELQKTCEEAAYYIDSAMAELEDVRCVNQELRQWGEEWKQLAKAAAPDAMRLEWVLANGAGSMNMRDWTAGNADSYAVGFSREEIDACMGDFAPNHDK